MNVQKICVNFCSAQNLKEGVFAETSAEEIADKVRALAKETFRLWRTEKTPLLGFERVMARMFPATYQIFRACPHRFY